MKTKNKLKLFAVTLSAISTISGCSNELPNNPEKEPIKEIHPREHSEEYDYGYAMFVSSNIEFDDILTQEKTKIKV